MKAALEVQMEKWQKPSEQTISVYQDVVSQLDGIEKRKMFGCPCAFVNGNMFFGVYQDQLFLRMDIEQREHLSQIIAINPFSPMGKVMKAYISIPSEIVNEQKKLLTLVKNALINAQVLPPKYKKT
jgi:TfoX/Sxy family transcriptional regulator of competence genes